MSRQTYTARSAVRDALSSRTETRTGRAFVVGNYTADTASMLIQFNDPRTGIRGITTRARVRAGLFSAAVAGGTPVTVNVKHGRVEVIGVTGA